MALALTEPEATWDGKGWLPEGVTVPATPEGNHYVINGIKLFVHDAIAADYLLVATRTRKNRRAADGITLLLVDAKSPGISYTVLRTTAGDKKQCEVVFDRVKVPAKNIVGKLHGGWPTLERVINTGAVLLSAQMVGSAEKAMEMAVEHAKTRV